MTEIYTRRVAIAGLLSQILCATPLRAAASDYDWQPARISPDINVSFENRRSQSISLSAFQGRPILLNIWATWCAPCVIELPALDRLQRDMKNRLSVIALSVDRSGMPAVLQALRRLSVRRLEPYVDVRGDVVSQLKVPGLPATFAISASGKFLQIRRGRVNWDDPGERARLLTILKI